MPIENTASAAENTTTQATETAAPAAAPSRRDQLSALDTMLMEGLQGDAKQEPAKAEAPKAPVQAEKPAEKPPEEDQADLLARNLRRDRDVRAREKALADKTASFKEIEARDARIKDAIASRNFVALAKEMAPDADPNEILLELFTKAANDEKPLTQAEVDRMVSDRLKAEKEAEEKAKATREQEEQAKGKAAYEAKRDEYLGVCEKVVADPAKFPWLSKPGFMRRFDADVKAYLDQEIRAGRAVATPSEVMAMLEADLVKQWGSANASAPRPVADTPGFTSRETRDDTGAALPVTRKLTRREQLEMLDKELMSMG